MATEKIMMQIDDKIIELKGAEKEAFIAQRESDLLIEEQRKAQQEAQKQIKISAYAKLGLTEEEINAIL